jgi:hypothetical protein
LKRTCMNIRSSICVGLALLTAILVIRSSAQDQPAKGAFEYVTIRWGGKDNTHLIRPGGKVEFVGFELRKLAKPDRADERSFYMNAAMNGLTKDGFEFAGMTSDEIIMKRALVR